jgi:hypothetical protein
MVLILFYRRNANKNEFGIIVGFILYFCFMLRTRGSYALLHMTHRCYLFSDILRSLDLYYLER